MYFPAYLYTDDVKAYGETNLFSDREADMKWLGSPRDPPQGLLRVWPLATCGEPDLEVLENQCREDEKFRSGQILSHAYPFPHPVGRKLLLALSIQEPVGVEHLRLIPIFWVEVKCYDIVKHHAVLGYLVPIEKTVLLGTVGQRAGSNTADPLNFHDGGITVGQNRFIVKGRASPI